MILRPYMIMIKVSDHSGILPRLLVPLNVLGDVQDPFVRKVVSRELDALDGEQSLSPNHPEDCVVHAALLDEKSVELGLFLSGK